VDKAVSEFSGSKPADMAGMGPQPVSYFSFDGFLIDIDGQGVGWRLFFSKKSLEEIT